MVIVISIFCAYFSGYNEGREDGLKEGDKKMKKMFEEERNRNKGKVRIRTHDGVALVDDELGPGGTKSATFY